MQDFYTQISYGGDPATILKFKKIILVFSKVIAIWVLYATFSILHGIINL